ncbi:hypothetical protein SMCARI_064 [Candidatus Karelsulcia muelleri CARI]|uniref:Uncharacterized protein n=1 Tax=Karelsulcia muelleri (strain CARI) TaxID=706194 RepID=E0TJB8_KARMC|nr:hypothetical protein SMCARI_064 [Candidatus Karelsulcia muelleri CARI]
MAKKNKDKNKIIKKMTKILFMVKKNKNYSFKEKIIHFNDVNNFLFNVG